MITTWDIGPGFDPVQFLDRPQVAHLATVWRGRPRVRPIWFLFDGAAFWWLTGGWSVLGRQIDDDPSAELVVDSCNLATREVLQVRARGDMEVRPYDEVLARRWAERYLGGDRTDWGRFGAGVFEDPSTIFVRMQPSWLRARDLSW